MPLFLECESDLDLGFAEKAPSWLLGSRFFHSKLGGRPSWLNLSQLPQTEDLTCQNCENPLVFLLQIYAPLDANPKSFHRVIFVFMCVNAGCHQGLSTKPFVVLRCQLGRQNEFFPYEPPMEFEGEDRSRCPKLLPGK